MAKFQKKLPTAKTATENPPKPATVPAPATGGVEVVAIAQKKPAARAVAPPKAASKPKNEAAPAAAAAVASTGWAEDIYAFVDDIDGEVEDMLAAMGW